MAMSPNCVDTENILSNMVTGDQEILWICKKKVVAIFRRLQPSTPRNWCSARLSSGVANSLILDASTEGTEPKVFFGGEEVYVGVFIDVDNALWLSAGDLITDPLSHFIMDGDTTASFSYPEDFQTVP